MHDVLAHRISQVSMHAGALAFRTDLDADEMRASATIIQDTAHEALTDLRGVLGVLRDPETGEPLEPPAADVRRPARRWSRRSASAGCRSATTTGSATPATELPDVIGRTVYRIVQEGMTNAAQARPGHALPDRGQRVARGRRRPSSCATRSALRAGVHARAPASGWSASTERAELRGGRLEGRREDGALVLRGWIPWAA